MLILGDVNPGRRRSAPVGRYDPREIGARIDKRRRQLGMTVREVCEPLGMHRWDWSRKVRCRGSHFTLEECGALADMMRAPPGWPFLPEEASPATGLQ